MQSVFPSVTLQDLLTTFLACLRDPVLAGSNTDELKMWKNFNSDIDCLRDSGDCAER